MGAWERRLADNLAGVSNQIAEAARGSGRSPSDVTLVAVTKYVDSDVTASLVRAGCHHLGESRPQVLWQKADALRDLPIEWHMIGHLQRNKIRRTLPLVACIHSADSDRLLGSLDDEARRAARTIRVLLEVNISGDAEKTGLRPDQLPPLVERIAQWDSIALCGLMAMSGRWSDPAQSQREFAQLRQLRDRLQTCCPAGTSLRELSMGMSHDFPLAVKEGATMVRVGSALFEGVDV